MSPIEIDVAKSVPGFTLQAAFRNAAGITGLFGRSGSGKSMTLGLVAGLLRPDRGHVIVGDTALVDLPRLCLPSHRRRVGLVFQDALLFPHLSVRRNLTFGRRFAPRGANRVSFEATVDTLGLGPLLDRRPTHLSGGERQRVAIGRALLAAPRLLLMDEPLAALDRRRKLEILPLIEQLRDASGVPILYVSHAVEEIVRLAAHVVVLEAGRVVSQGAPATVFGARQSVEEPRFGRVSVVDVTVGEMDAPYGLTALRHASGTLWLAGPAGAPGRRVRALVRAADVSLAVAPLDRTSIRSHLAGTILDIVPDGPLATVEIGLKGGGTLLALVTRRALDDLELQRESPIHAMIKTVALDEAAVSREA